MNRKDAFTHEGITYTVINIFEDGKIEGRAMVPIGTPGSSPSMPKSIIIAEGEIVSNIKPTYNETV